MSIKMMTLVGSELPQWLRQNSVGGTVGEPICEGYRVHPTDPEDIEGTKELIRAGRTIIEGTKLIAKRECNGLVLVRIKSQGKTVLCAYERGYSYPPALAGSCTFFSAAHDLHFLQFAWLAVSNKLRSSSPIPDRLVKDSAFEEDILEYLPKPLALEAEEEVISESDNIFFCKALISLSRDNATIADKREQLLELMYALPEDADHAWMYSQLMAALRSQRLPSLYLGLYRLYEFFFALPAIADLKKRLQYPASDLSLISHCKGGLGWTINHNKGGQSAAAYVNVKFAEICLNETLPAEATKDAIAQFKARATEKLQNARHTLTHQQFAEDDILEADLDRYCLALIDYLCVAFLKYTSSISLPVSLGQPMDAPAALP